MRVGILCTDLRRATQAAGADMQVCLGCQRCTVGYQHIAHIFTRPQNHESQPHRLSGRQVFEAMHRHIDTPFMQGAFYFSYKDTIAPNLCKRHMSYAITRCANLLYSYLQLGPLLPQPLDDLFRLYHRQLAGSRAYSYLFH